MAIDVDIDVEVLKCEIKKTYARVSQEPDEDFIFPTGRTWALDLGNTFSTSAQVRERIRSWPRDGGSKRRVRRRRGRSAAPRGRELGCRHLERRHRLVTDSRRKAEQFGARGHTVKAHKPRR
jgi:hypothetical protein